MESLTRAFGGSSSSDDQEALWAILDAATRAWPTVTLAPDRYMAYLAERSGGGIRPLSELRCTDLYLACACLQSDPAALARLDEVVLPSLDPALRQLDPNPAFIEEVKQLVRLRLLLAKDGPPKLAEYRGEGSLLKWARVVAVRVGLKHLQSQRNHKPTDEDEALAALPTPGANAELDYLRAQHRKDFSAAFAEALASLDARDRNVLRLNLLDQLNIEQIGSIYGTHRSTVARWIASAREDLVKRTRKGLATRLKLTSEELDSLMGVVVSQLDISINRFLREA